MSKARLAALVVSVAGLGFIATHEGKSNAAYQDPAYGWGVPTICYGHTASARQGQWRTDQQCLELLAADAREAADAVLDLAQVPLTQGELDAYTSFTFNVGRGNLAKSTLLKKLNAGDHVGACHQLLRWDYAGATKLPGLTKRRKDEEALCLRDIQ